MPTHPRRGDTCLTHARRYARSMAGWQTGFVLVPRASWELLVQPRRPIAQGTSALWAFELAEEWFTHLTDALGAATPGPDATTQRWGDTDTHDVELRRAPTDADRIESLSFRLDLRSRELALVLRVLAFAHEHDLVILDAHGRSVAPERDALAAHLRGSAAAEYVATNRAEPVPLLEALAAAT